MEWLEDMHDILVFIFSFFSIAQTYIKNNRATLNKHM